MSKLQDLKNQGKLAGWWDFRNKTLFDQSNNTNNLSPAGTVKWLNGRYGSGIQFFASGILTAADHASLDPSALTILYFGEVPNALTGTNLYFTNKHVCEFAIAQATGRPFVYNRVTTVTSSSVVDFRGARMVGVRYGAGEKPDFFKNGSYTDTGANNMALSDVANNFGIGNYLSPSEAFNMEGICYGVVFANVKLTGQEIRQIYDEFYAVKGSGDPKLRNYKSFAPLVDTDCLVALDFSQRTSDKKVVDSSGNNKHGTVTLPLSITRMASGLTGADFQETSNVTIPSTALGTTHTIEWVMSGNRNISVALGLATSYVCYYVDSGGYRIVYNPGTGGVNWPIVLDGLEHHFVVRRVGTSVTLYVDGVSLGAKTLSADTAITWTTLTGVSLGYPWKGNIAYIQAYSTDKGDVWATNRYRQYAKNIIFNPQPEYYLPTLANVTAGALSNTGFEVKGGAYKVSQEILKNSGQKLADGDMEAAGVAMYTADNGAILSKQLGARTGGTGTQILRVANTANWGAARESVATVEVGKVYRITGWARGDGSTYPALGQGSIESIWVGTSSADWQYFDRTFLASATYVRYTKGSSAGETYAEFDDIVVQEIGSGRKWIELATLGVNASAVMNSQRAFGTYVFDFFPGALTSENSFGFIASTFGGYASYTGYAFFVWNTGAIGVLRCTGGGSAGVITSAAGYISAGVEYKLAISRSGAGIFRMFIKGGAYVNWTLVGESTSDLTYTTSKLLNFYSLNAGTKYRLLGIHQGVLGISELNTLYK